MTTNPYNTFVIGMRVQFRNVHVRRDHPELHTGTVTSVHHHVVNVAWDPTRPGADPSAGSYHYSSLVEVPT
jgi:hypothetical protein